jgi:hypothetical protein
MSWRFMMTQRIERVDTIPLIYAMLKRMGVEGERKRDVSNFLTFRLPLTASRRSRRLRCFQDSIFKTERQITRDVKPVSQEGAEAR